jgi:hypothetical protein
MTSPQRWIALAIGLSLLTAACGGDDDGGDGDQVNAAGKGGGSGAAAMSGAGAGNGAAGEGFGNANNPPGGGTPVVTEPPKPNPEAFWAEDPPPMVCLADGTMGPPPTPPGGTPECPDDKNREGCPCTHVGEVTDCWPGLRANRNRGVCRDGKTECLAFGDVNGTWGECDGYMLPVDGAIGGPEACGCFSAGTWAIDNLSPCFIAYSGGPNGDETWAVSTFIGANGMSGCPADPMGPPAVPMAGTTWSTSRLKVDCAGQFELCYTLKAGDSEDPKATDCVLTRQCVETWYETAGAEQELPELPAWASDDPACAEAFQVIGGYGEMTVKGLSAECDDVDDGAGNELVFNRVPYCPASCSMMPELAECQNCSMGGSGDF